MFLGSVDFAASHFSRLWPLYRTRCGPWSHLMTTISPHSRSAENNDSLKHSSRDLKRFIGLSNALHSDRQIDRQTDRGDVNPCYSMAMGEIKKRMPVNEGAFLWLYNRYTLYTGALVSRWNEFVIQSIIFTYRKAEVHDTVAYDLPYSRHISPAIQQ